MSESDLTNNHRIAPEICQLAVKKASYTGSFITPVCVLIPIKTIRSEFMLDMRSAKRFIGQSMSSYISIGQLYSLEPLS